MMGIHLDSISKFSLICPSAVNRPSSFFSSSTLLCLAWLKNPASDDSHGWGLGGFVVLVWKLELMTSYPQSGAPTGVVDGVMTYHKWPKIK